MQGDAPASLQLYDQLLDRPCSQGLLRDDVDFGARLRTRDGKYVSDADAVHQRAAAAGARTIEALADTPYGDRRAMIEDAWQIATYRE